MYNFCDLWCWCYVDGIFWTLLSKLRDLKPLRWENNAQCRPIFLKSFSTFYYEITTEEVICNNKLYNNIFHKSGMWNISTEDMFPSVIFNIDWTIWVKWFDQKKGLKTQKCTSFSSGQICHQMHVAKFLKTEIILVTDSIAWVRCNSGNFWYFNVVVFLWSFGDTWDLWNSGRAE